MTELSVINGGRETPPDRKKKILITYMLLKVETEDWHVVADVANDIRELEAQYPNLRQKAG